MRGVRPIGVSPDQSGQQVNPRFIHENQAAALAAGLSPQGGPDFALPVLDLRFVSLKGASHGNLGRPPEVFEEPRDMALVICHAEFLFQDLRHPAPGPALTVKLLGLGAVPGKIGEQQFLDRRELWQRIKMGARTERYRSALPGGSELVADGTGRDPQSLGNQPLLPPPHVHIPSTLPSPLPPAMRNRTVRHHTQL
jgi:hypothetical protein